MNFIEFLHRITQRRLTKNPLILYYPMKNKISDKQISDKINIG